MAIAVRTARTTWERPLATGTGTVRMGSGATGELPVRRASELCPVSRLFAVAKITVDAVLELAP